MGGTGAGHEPGPAADAQVADAPGALETSDRPETAGLRVEVIGAGAVRREAAAVTGLELGGRRARVALAALALAGGPVPADRLAELIWPDAPPPTWPAALRGVIRSLRAALEAVQAGGQRLIVTTPSGYCLAPGTRVDLDLAEAALTEAAAAAGHGRPRAAIAAASAAASRSRPKKADDGCGTRAVCPGLVPPGAVPGGEPPCPALPIAARYASMVSGAGSTPSCSARIARHAS